MARSTKKTHSEKDTTERLITSATEIFSEKGFDGSTVKEIADHAGVNISLISYHFNGKEGLLRKCVEKFGETRLQESEKILTPPDSKEDLKAKMKLWAQQFLLCQVEDDQICQILHRENLLERDFMGDIFQSTFLKAFESMVKFLHAAKKKGIARKEIDPLIAAGMIYGALLHLGQTKKIQEKQFGISIENEKYRAQAIEQFMEAILNGIS